MNVSGVGRKGAPLDEETIDGKGGGCACSCRARSHHDRPTNLLFLSLQHAVRTLYLFYSYLLTAPLASTYPLLSMQTSPAITSPLQVNCASQHLSHVAPQSFGFASPFYARHHRPGEHGVTLHHDACPLRSAAVCSVHRSSPQRMISSHIHQEQNRRSPQAVSVATGACGEAQSDPRATARTRVLQGPSCGTSLERVMARPVA